MQGISEVFEWLQVVQLKAFEKFGSTTAALSAAAAIIDSKLEKGKNVMKAAAMIMMILAL